MQIPLTPIRCLYRAVDLYPKKEGIICGPNRFTYAQFGARCERLGSALVALGLEPGVPVAYLSFNTHKLLEGYYGVVMARGLVMPLNVRLAPAELVAILNHSGARVLFYEADFAPLLEMFRRSCPAIVHYLALDDSYEELLGRGSTGRVDWMTFDELAPAELFYTSGSTGTPKGVVLSHRTLYLHALQVISIVANGDTDVDLHTIPLFHANGWSRPQVDTMMGLKQVMVRRFDPATVFRLVEEERATTMAVVPIMANALLMSPERGKYDVSSLRQIHVGGAAASPELIDALEKAFDCEATAGYGLTETSPVATDARPKSTLTYRDEEDRVHRQAMAGWPLVGVEVRVVDAEMREAPQDFQTIGEVVIRGDNVMDGYYREPAATAAVMSGGWFRTGDMAVWDEENYVHIVDRKKDIIISGGENISSIEVENTILAHAAVAECAVVAAPDEKWGEIPVAFVVLKPGHEVSEAMLAEFASQRLGKFKLPKRWIFKTEPLPKTGTAKVLKRELREQFWAHKAERVQG